MHQIIVKIVKFWHYVTDMKFSMQALYADV